MAIANLKVDFHGVGPVVVLDGAFPAESVLRGLRDLASVEASQSGPTYLQLAKTETAVAAWLARSSRARATLTVSGSEPADGKFVVDVVHHLNPRLREQGWVTLHSTTVGALEMAADESVPHVVISILKDYYVAEEKELECKQRSVLSASATTAKQLVTTLHTLERPLPEDLNRATTKIAKRLEGTWSAWAQFAAAAATELGEAGHAATRRIAQLDDMRTERDEHFPLASVHAQLRALHEMHYALVRARGTAAAAESGVLPPPDYDRMAQHITRELMAFYKLVRETTTNNDVLGALVEERLRKMLRRWLGGLQLATGSLAGLPADYQIDGIIWDPTIRPALIEEGETVVVDPLAVAGLLEIKASCNIEDFARRLFELAAHVSGYFDRAAEGRRYPPIFGFVLWDSQDYETMRRRTGRMITCLSRRERPDQFAPDPRAIADLLQFVYAQVHRRQ